MKRVFASFVVTCFFFISCTSENEPGDELPASTQLNVSYGADAKQKADIYLPANRSTTATKVMIMIHGGAWSSGDKTEFNIFVDTLKRRLPDYAIVNINYRLVSGNTNTFPTQENDLKALIDFIYSKRNDFQISDKFVLLGASAGGHLAMLQGYKYNNPVKIKAIIDYFGPADIVQMYNNPALLAPPALIAGIVGGTPTTNPTMYFQSSPINFINAQSPPTIIFQGGLDPLVLPSQSEAVKNKLSVNAVVHQYNFYPLGGHGDWSTEIYTETFNKIQAFLLANVQ